jgi:hypothetical protein
MTQRPTEIFESRTKEAMRQYVFANDGTDDLAVILKMLGDLVTASINATAESLVLAEHEIDQLAERVRQLEQHGAQ